LRVFYFPDSVEIATAGRQPAQQRAEIDQSPGDQMYDFACALYLAVDTEQAGAEQFLALSLDQAGMDDDIGQAGFIFQGDKDDAGGGTRALPANHDAGGAGELAVGSGSHRGGRNEP